MRSVLVVYTHRARSEATALAIESQPDLSCAGSVADGELNRLEEYSDPQPDVAILEAGAGCEVGTTIARLRERLPTIDVVVITDTTDPSLLLEAAKAGANAFISARDPLNQLLDAVRCADERLMLLPIGTFTDLAQMAVSPKSNGHAPGPDHDGGTSRPATAHLDASARGDLGNNGSDVPRGNPLDEPVSDLETEREHAFQRSGLTPRERDVLLMLGQGLDPQGIARELFMSVHTARGHLKSIMMKLGAHSQLEAVVVAARMGLLPELSAPVS